jgi:hypothetical protein
MTRKNHETNPPAKKTPSATRLSDRKLKGVVYLHQTESPRVKGRTPKHGLLIDIDETATATGEHMTKRVIPWFEELAEQHHIRPALLEEACADFKDRDQFHSIEYFWVDLADWMGFRFPLKPVELTVSVIRPFLKRMMDLEQQIKPLDGVIEGLRSIREEYPHCLIAANTNMPTWLAYARMHYSGVLEYVDALVGVDPKPPDNVGPDHPYYCCVEEVRGWLEAVTIIVPNNLQFVASVPWFRAKPNTTGARLILNWADPEAKMIWASCGDNAKSEGKVALCVNEKRTGAPVRFVHARQGGPKAPKDIPVHATIDRFPEILPVLRSLWRKKTQT